MALPTPNVLVWHFLSFDALVIAPVRSQKCYIDFFLLLRIYPIYFPVHLQLLSVLVGRSEHCYLVLLSVAGYKMQINPTAHIFL